MTIQRLTDAEFEAAFQLSCYAFQVSDAEERRTASRASWKNAIHYGEVVNGNVQAKLDILPFQVNVYGKSMPMGGIAGVASYPEYRRKGLVKKLIIHALDSMRSQGQLLSYLNPFSVPFYRAFGWEILCDEMTYTLNKHQLPKATPLTTGRISRVSFFDPLIRAVYERRQTHGMLERESWWWEELNRKYKSHTTAVYQNEDGEPTAYIVYQIEEDHFETEEMIYNDMNGLNALLSFIGQHDSMIKTAELPAASADALHYFLPDPKTKAETSPYFMARIVDVKAFLTQYPFVIRSGGYYTIKINDPYASWNQATFDLSLEKQIRCEPITTAPQLEMSIQTLTGLLLGYQRPSFYLKQGLIHGDLAIILAFFNHLPNEAPVLFDSF
ncbi:GNAT family N-acetyltransferase [Shouchella patagoniensis]|uniref:GNAT family N-acetyltransferase n=1 Tax=Shouchella patagoniensis TaxID=228576 RepID=UPI000994A256|nr:GNAT family N-acetyltransferase [Shouchella patagoniensis]